VVGTKVFNIKVIDKMVAEESGEVQYDACKWLTIMMRLMCRVETFHSLANLVEVNVACGTGLTVAILDFLVSLVSGIIVSV
jgi:hypothetical protein